MNYINAHATSTLLGDLSEINAIKQVFRNPSEIKINGTKVSFSFYSLNSIFFLPDSLVFILINLRLPIYFVYNFFLSWIVYDRPLSWGSKRIGGNCNYESNKNRMVASNNKSICELDLHWSIYRGIFWTYISYQLVFEHTSHWRFEAE